MYAIQRDYTLTGHYLTARRISRVQNMIWQCYIDCDQRELEGITGLGYMLELIDFIDDRVLRCWRQECWSADGEDYQHQHVPAATVCSLLRRYSLPAALLGELRGDAQHADILITRHWIRHIIWNIGFQHGFMDEANPDVEMRPSYAIRIAQDTIDTCDAFSMGCLEVHGVGLVWT